MQKEFLTVKELYRQKEKKKSKTQIILDSMHRVNWLQL